MATINTFEGIIEFVALAEAGSFTAAAKRLGVSTSHISRQVAALEARLAVKLVNRTTRQNSLTALGQDYYEHALRLVDGLDGANRQVIGEGTALSGTVRISLAGHFCDHYVAPALAAFAVQHTDLRLDLNYSTRFVNFVDEGIDFAIRFGPMPEGNLIARKLADQKRVAVASPGYLEARGMPTHPSQLAEHDCITSATDHWTFNVDGEEKRYRVSGRFKGTSQPAIVSAVQAGLGIAYMPARSFGPGLLDGSLIEVLKGHTSVKVYNWIVYPDRRHLMTRARAVADYLLEHFRDWRS